jgi:protein arginine N-methyltransferase 1
MITLKKASIRLFASLRRILERLETWLEHKPGLSAWFYPTPEARSEADRRAHNGLMFADFHEQERMLADKRRMAFYKAAIERHVQPGDRVVDLGTGTGILAALAARRGAAHVYVIDHSEILSKARLLADANKVRNVEFLAIHSSAFKVAQPLDVILHEQMGDCLFDEAMVANVADLRDRLLGPNGIILPSLFEFYCEPIKVRDDRLVPFIWELEVYGYDYACLEGCRPTAPAYYNLASSDLNLVEHFLGDPEPVLLVDLRTIKEKTMPKEVSFTRRVVNAGRLDGFAVYFRARVDELTLTSSPLDPCRAPHWGFRILRTDRDEFSPGDEIDVTLRVGAWSNPDTWRWSHSKRAVPELGLAGRHP